MRTDKYRIILTLKRVMLATNPCDPHVMDTHIHQRQRKLILDKSKVNSQINKYLDALAPSEEKTAEEQEKLFAKLEELMGITLTPEEKAKAIAGDLEGLKENFKTLDTTGTTVFFWNAKEDLPCIGDHMIYGFLKASAAAQGKALQAQGKRKRGTMLESIAYTQSIINQHVRCEEEFITFDKDVLRDEEGNSLFLQRSLRVKTMQGPRVSLAKSEQVPAGAKIEFTLCVMEGSPLTKAILHKLFSYGEMCGLGQWRNSGKGMFTYEMVKL
jgi:hypothetical protein